MQILTAVLLFLVVLTSAGRAAAQTEAVISPMPGSAPFGQLPYTAGVDLDRQQILWTTPSPGGHVAVSGDGRFTFWSGGELDATQQTSTYHVDIRDVVTGSITRVRTPASVRRLVSHPRRFQLFALFEGLPPQSIDASGARPLASCSAPADMLLTLDGRLLFVLCDAEVAVVSADTLVAVRVLTLPWPARKIAVNSDGSRLAAARNVTNDLDATLSLLDGESGTLIAEVAPPPLLGAGWTRGLSLLEPDSDRTRLFVSFHQTRQNTVPFTMSHAGSTIVYRFSDLQKVGELQPTGAEFLDSLAFTPDGTKAVGANSMVVQSSLASLFLIDPAALTVQVQRVGFGSFPPAIAIAAPPLAPARLSAATTVDAVTLAWDLPLASPMVTRYHVDVRTSPAGPVFATFTTSESVLSVRNAPAGTYHVSVRGENYRGVGPSTVVTEVVVP